MRTAFFIVETYQGSFVPVSAHAIRIDEIGDSFLEPLSYAMPYVLVEQARDFLYDHAPIGVDVYDTPIKMNPVGIKWLSEIEAVQ